MAGTIVPILSTCRLQGRPVEDLYFSPKCLENGKPSFQKLLDALTRNYGWNPILIKKPKDRIDWMVSAQHSIHNDVKDFCEEFIFPDGRKAYVFSYDWDYHNENENVFHVIDVTDDAIVLTGFIPYKDGSADIFFASRKDLEKLYKDLNPTLEYIPVAIAFNNKMIVVDYTYLSKEEKEYIRKATEHSYQNGYVQGTLRFNKAIVKP